MILAGLVAACARAGEVFVAAAASLTDVMKAVEPLFLRDHPGVKITFVYGSTGMLRTQLLKGAPCDVFIGADRWFGGTETNVDEVVVADSVRLVAANSLVAVTGAGASPHGGTLASWLEGARKIGIGNPASVPVGRYTKKLLETEKLWEVSSTKFVQGSNVREVLLWLRQGVVDVGFVYGSDLVAAKDAGLKTLAEYATPSGTAVELAGGITKAAKNASEGQAFLDYLKTAEAVEVFRGLGFRVTK
jgi:molybdate transport system substrate-binding protein